MASPRKLSDKPEQTECSEVEKNYEDKKKNQVGFNNSYDSKITKQIQKEIMIQLHQDLFCYFLNKKIKEDESHLAKVEERIDRIIEKRRMSIDISFILDSYRKELASHTQIWFAHDGLKKHILQMEACYRKKEVSLLRQKDIYNKSKHHFDHLCSEMYCHLKPDQCPVVNIPLEKKIHDVNVLCFREADLCNSKRVELCKKFNMHHQRRDQCYMKIVDTYEDEIYAHSFCEKNDLLHLIMDQVVPQQTVVLVPAG